MSEKLTKEDQLGSEVLVNLSEEKRNKEETKLTKAQRLYKEIELGDRRFAQKLKDANDFKAGFFQFNSQVSESTVELLLHNLRRFTRLFPKRPIMIELDSPGGSILDGFHLYDELIRIKREGDHHLTIRVRGMAASMAVPILQAADDRIVGWSAWVMIHRAAFGAIGKAYEIEDQVEFVQRIEGKIVDILVERGTQSREFYMDLFKKRKDIWYSAEEAVELGLADQVG